MFSADILVLSPFGQECNIFQ